MGNAESAGGLSAHDAGALPSEEELADAFGALVYHVAPIIVLLEYLFPSTPRLREIGRLILAFLPVAFCVGA